MTRDIVSDLLEWKKLRIRIEVTLNITGMVEIKRSSFFLERGCLKRDNHQMFKGGHLI